MVWIARPCAEASGVTQDRTASPSSRTVHAPQAATPQPNLVPVSRSSSRMTHSRGVSGGESEK